VRLLLRWKFLVGALGAVLAWTWAVRALQMVDANQQVKLTRSLAEVQGYSQALPYFLGGEGNIGGLVLRALPFAAVVCWLACRPGLRAALRSRHLGMALALPLCLLLLVGVGPHPSQQSGVYEFFYRHMPLFSTQRVPGKMFSVAALLLLVLWLALYELVAAERRLLRAALLVVLVAQPLQQLAFIHTDWPGIKLSDMSWGSGETVTWLRSHATPDDIVLNVPFMVRRSRYETLPLYLAYRTRARMADGYYGSLPPPYLVDSVPLLETFNGGVPGPAAFAAARAHGYTLLLLDGNHWPLGSSFAAVRAAFDVTPSLERVACDDELCLYRFR
jgi:hypothetical protein